MEILIASMFSFLLGFVFGSLLTKENISTATHNSIKNFSEMKSVIRKNTKKYKPKICDDQAMMIKERES